MSFISRHIEGPLTASPGWAFNDAFHAGVKDLRDHGFARVNILTIAVAPWHVSTVPLFLQKVGSKLLPDPYDLTGTRKRSYARFVWVAETGALVPVGRNFDSADQPVTSYSQDAVVQTEFGNVLRVFPGMRESIASSPILRSIVQADGAMAIQSGVLFPSLAYLVGIHIIKLQPNASEPAVITPDEIHRDGEPVTFAHLIERSNCHGGENFITSLDAVGKRPGDVAPENIYSRLTLFEPGDSFVVDDKRVGHYVSPVARVAPNQSGHRTIMLVDFCPLRPELSID